MKELFIVDLFHIFDDAVTADGQAIVDVAAQPSPHLLQLFSVKIDNLELLCNYKDITSCLRRSLW